MDTIVVSSGYPVATLEAMRRHWHVVDIKEPGDTLEHLRRCARLPLAVVIGFAAPPPEDTDARPPRYPAQVLLPQILELDPDLPVVISTAQRAPASIVSLIQAGAFDYVVEPRPPREDEANQAYAAYTQDLVHALSRAVQWRRTILENRRLKRRQLDVKPDRHAEARSPGMVRALALAEKVAPTPATVLVTGESGAGKELVARAIHAASPRSAEPFVAINCSALSESLLASELFGHVKGAFTGADADRTGLIRQAAEGTLLLDEIASVPASFQVMLLRVLEERQARPVGAQREYPVRCRFIAASNRGVAELVREGTFREDLYYRLNVFHIDVPPLRQRPEDTPVLAQHFLRAAASQFGKAVVGFEPAAMQRLEAHHWPGNVRQLRNVIERAVILCEGRRITPADLAPELRGEASDTGEPTNTPHADPVDYHNAMRRYETHLLRGALERADGNVSAAARALGMKRTTLSYRLRQLGLGK